MIYMIVYNQLALDLTDRFQRGSQRAQYISL
jgi:hypothetical protein